MNKQILFKVFSVFVLVVYLVGLTLVGRYQLQVLSQQGEFVGVVRNLPSRFHSSMTFAELAHLSKVVTELASGPSSAQGLAKIPELDQYIGLSEGENSFDIENVRASLESNALEDAQSELVRLSVIVSEVHRNNHIKLVLLLLAGLVIGCCMAGLVVSFFRTTKLAVFNIDDTSIDLEDAVPSSPLSVAVHNVSHLESVKSGHDYVLEIQGDELLRVTDTHYTLIEASICEMVSNAIVHGGRASAVRSATGKPSTIKIFIGIKKENNQWFITVADDGEGIDEMYVMQHAVAKNILTQETVKTLDEGVGVKLILADGFSAAKKNRTGPLQSNSLAGIREAVQLAGGSIALRNRPKVFCEFKVKLPS